MSATGRNQKRILLVDDSLTVLKILSKGLRDLGYEVITAEDGSMAADLLEEIVVDLVLTDLNMPNMDGFQLIEHIRDQESMKDLPIIVLTSSGDVKSMRRALDSGANIYLHKPAPLPKLRYKVMSLLGDVPRTTEKISAATKLVAQEARDHVEQGYRELDRRRRLDTLSADMHIEMYLFAENDEEATELLADFDHRPDVGLANVLPLTLDEGLSSLQLVRLYRLIARRQMKDCLMPLLHRFESYEDEAVRVAIVDVAVACDGREYLDMLIRLRGREASAAIGRGQEAGIVISALDHAIDVLAPD